MGPRFTNKRKVAEAPPEPRGKEPTRSTWQRNMYYQHVDVVSSCTINMSHRRTIKQKPPEATRSHQTPTDSYRQLQEDERLLLRTTSNTLPPNFFLVSPCRPRSTPQKETKTRASRDLAPGIRHLCLRTAVGNQMDPLGRRFVKTRVSHPACTMHRGSPMKCWSKKHAHFCFPIVSHTVAFFLSPGYKRLAPIGICCVIC